MSRSSLRAGTHTSWVTNKTTPTLLQFAICEQCRREPCRDVRRMAGWSRLLERTSVEPFCFASLIILAQTCSIQRRRRMRTLKNLMRKRRRNLRRKNNPKSLRRKNHHQRKGCRRVLLQNHEAGPLQWSEDNSSPNPEKPLQPAGRKQSLHPRWKLLLRKAKPTAPAIKKPSAGSSSKKPAVSGRKKVKPPAKGKSAVRKYLQVKK